MTDPYEELAATIDNLVTSTFVTPMGPEFLDSVLEAAFEKANVAIDYRGEFEPTEVVITEAFEVMPHEQIAAMVGSLGTATIVNSSKNWNDLSAAATTGSDGFRSGIEAAMTSGWSGPTADAVRGGVGNYVSSATALSTSMSLISNKLLEAHSGFTQTQSRMPPVVAAGSSMIDALLPIPFAAKDAVSAREEQQEEARRIMRSVYVPGVLQSDSQVPVLPAAHNPIADGDGSSGGWGLGNSAGGGGGGVWSTSGNSGADGADSAARTAATQAQPGGPEAAEAGRTGTPAEQSGSGGPGSLPPADNSGETRAASATGPGASGGGAGPGVGAGPGGGYGGTGPGSSGFTGSTGSGYGGGAGYAGGSGAGSGYGGSVLGPPIGGGAGGGGAGGTGGPGSAAAASAGRAGAHGMPGMGAMGGAGARGAGDNDREHATPGYLVDVSNGSELIGDLPLVAPPVLGG
ncbi:PPE domain-containing protein [Rhodococcus sp. IEGM 1330]|uniref:PPE domain-containing protein n=1 Tax=Rhodococcus sp. IEGM 1330 TaxID=3082225 RepID=UPI002954CE25|nr:PPE domain-containing protein [Rhodococcus sp. IEGM 1330]MDV8021125.1 PPE domain-containing protein [Rhodococcus sp. IEGM 1330]